MHDLLLALYFSFLVAGNVFLLYANLIARLAWREDIPPYGFRTPTFAVLFHPERFVRKEKASAVRRLAVIGCILLFFCLAAVLTDIFMSVGF
ncbi:MAG: hypothetical protein IPH06_04555 [Alphaproteobacteria bacterium]|jgi:hypothetical protein|nr:hypothetical protein [Alphaproteobacteria bacterium]QQS57299.1 MAG: hypothetical protein IPN28_00315 [Alphaproteobacteria bacterium]